MTDTLTSITDNQSDAASRIRSVRTRWWKTAGEWLKPPLIALAGLLGVLGIVLTVLPFFGWNTIVLTSGSMTPTYPAGSVLLAHEVPAAEAAVGDVVMVLRPGKPPVTHRVIGTEAGPAGAATLTLQGDANTAADPEPYTVGRVGLVAGGIPWGGQVLAAIRSPFMLGTLSVLVAALVLWSWWPKRGEGRHAQDS
jgi:signal peptidase